MAKVGMKLEGATSVTLSLGVFKSSMQRRILRGALTKGARIVAKAAKSMAPKETGLLKKSIGFVVKTYPSKQTAAVIGPRRGFRQLVTRTKRFPAKLGASAFESADLQVSEMANPVNYAHLVEYGTEPHDQHPGTPPRPFMRPALETNKGAVVSAINQHIADAVQNFDWKSRKMSKEEKAQVNDLAELAGE